MAPKAKPLFKSKTVWGGILMGGSKLFAVVAPLAASGAWGEKVQGIALGVGTILAAVGVRSALNPK